MLGHNVIDGMVEGRDVGMAWSVLLQGVSSGCQLGRIRWEIWLDGRDAASRDVMFGSLLDDPPELALACVDICWWLQLRELGLGLLFEAFPVCLPKVNEGFLGGIY